MTMYIGAAGQGTILIGEDAAQKLLLPDAALIVPGRTLCGMETDAGMVYTEIILENNTEKEIIMNPNRKNKRSN